MKQIQEYVENIKEIQIILFPRIIIKVGKFLQVSKKKIKVFKLILVYFLGIIVSSSADSVISGRSIKSLPDSRKNLARNLNKQQQFLLRLFRRYKRETSKEKPMHDSRLQWPGFL